MFSSDVPESFLSSQSHKSESSQSHQKVLESSHDMVESSHKNCRAISSHWFASSSHCRVK